MRPGSTHDYDGDGDKTEAIKDEIAGLEEKLYDAIQTYAENIIGKPIVYDDEYPYFFNDSNGNALPEDEEVSQLNQYRDFDATLLKAAYNYQASSKELAGYIHNALYIAQVMVDSIEDLDGDVNDFAWR